MALRRTVRLMTADLRSGILTTSAAVTARAFRARATVIGALLLGPFLVPFLATLRLAFPMTLAMPFLRTACMRPRCRPAAPVVLGRGGGSLLTAAGSAAVFAGQGQADQPLDVAQIG